MEESYTPKQLAILDRLEQLIKDEESGKVPMEYDDYPPLPPLPTQEADVVAVFVPKKPS